MKLLKKINEDAAGGSIGGGAVAAFAMPLFSTLVKRAPPVPQAKLIKYGRKKKEKSLKLGEAYKKLMELDPNGPPDTTSTPPTGTSFDTSEVISKLKSLENKEKTDHRDVTVFGLEDGDKGIVRVTIKNEQAEEFEKALQSFMSDIEEDEDIPEIAEMLFKLKDHFDIVDVEWPEVAEDEEQEQGVAGGEPGMPGEPGAGAGEDLLGGEPGAGEDLLGGEPGAGEAPMGGEDTGQVKDLLSQVIDMMKADAEARKAEAKARETEAAAKQVSSKVKQEEQILDMEAYNKSKKEEEKEAKRLAQLARFKHEMGGEGEDEVTDMGSSHEEEEIHQNIQTPQHAVTTRQGPTKAATVQGRVHPHDIARFILNRIK